MRWLLVASFCITPLFAGLVEGERLFRSRCASCHGGNAEGGERGPSITAPVSLRADAELADLIRNGLPGAGMPGSPLNAEDMQSAIAYLRTLVPRRLAPERITAAGVSGIVRNKSEFDMQVQGDDGRIHLLRRGEGDGWREVRGDRDWPTYHGDYSGNRHSPLSQIDRSSVNQLRTAWTYSLPGAQRLQVTPVVVDGVMYVTNVNEVHAIDAGTGRRIWQYKRPRSKGVVIGDAASGINRGVAIHGNRLFTVTDHAHLIALNRITGALLWDVEMADYRENYGATSAPLVVGDLVISGTSGGDEGVRGFLAAYKVSSGERAWRFWTVPAPGEPLAETWQGKALPHGCATTWMTGTYDPQLDLLYWTTGNPCPDYSGDERKGDNLYSDSVLALRPKTGELAWYFQYTPHDLHDWDSVQTPMLIDVDSRKLLVQANRNGFFYVLDRTNGQFVRGGAFVKRLTWSKGLDEKGRPIVLDQATPVAAGTTACPAVEGATNWFSTAFHAGSGLFYVQALEKCNIYTKAPAKWEAGKSYYDGDTHDIPGDPGVKYLRALDVRTGAIAWERKQTGAANSWGGVLSTNGGLVFVCDDSGYFIAVDARSGEVRWRYPTNYLWKASPMTYSMDDRQYIAVAAGGNILAFTLPETPERR